MSYQQRHYFGRQEFRKFPLLDFEPLPEHNFADQLRYHNRELNQTFGSRLRLKPRIFICPDTKRGFVFRDNYELFRKKLLPHLVHKTEFQSYRSPDGTVYHSKKGHEGHSKIVALEREKATELSRRHELNVHDNKPAAEQITTGDNYGTQAQIKKNQWPCHAEDLYPDVKDELERRLNLSPPEYHGWTHSDNADSWYLESKTLGNHGDYENFYVNLMRKQHVFPKIPR